MATDTYRPELPPSTIAAERGLVSMSGVRSPTRGCPLIDARPGTRARTRRTRRGSSAGSVSCVMSARRSTGSSGAGVCCLSSASLAWARAPYSPPLPGTPSGGGLLSVTGGSFRRGQELAASLLLGVAMPCFSAALRARTGPARLSARRWARRRARCGRSMPRAGRGSGRLLWGGRPIRLICAQYRAHVRERKPGWNHWLRGGCPQRRELVLPCPLHIEAARLEAGQLGLELVHAPV